jgi:hypothetical protein
VSQIKGNSTVGRTLITGTAGCDGSLLVVRLLALGCEVVDAACFIGTYPRECKLHNLERAASAGGFRLVEGDYHDYHVVIHGTSWLPGCAKETTYRNCQRTAACSRPHSGQTPPAGATGYA